MYNDALGSTGLFGTYCSSSPPSIYLQVYNDAVDSIGLNGTCCSSSPPSSIFTSVQYCSRFYWSYHGLSTLSSIFTSVK